MVCIETLPSSQLPSGHGYPGVPHPPKTAAHQHVCFLGKTRKKKLLEYDSMVEERKSDPSSVWGPRHPQTKQQQHKLWCGRRALEGAQMDSRCAFCTGNSLSSTHVHLENKQAIKGRRQKKNISPKSGPLFLHQI